MKFKIFSCLICMIICNNSFSSVNDYGPLNPKQSFHTAALVANDVYSDEPSPYLEGMVRVMDSGKPGADGYFGALYVNNAEHPLEAWFSHRGTYSPESLFQDIDVLKEKSFSQLASAEAFERHALTTYFVAHPGITGYAETGHSLGAVIASVMTFSHIHYEGYPDDPDYSDSVRPDARFGCIAFENPGSLNIVKSYLEQSGIKNPDSVFASLLKIAPDWEYNLQGEPNAINMLNEQIGTTWLPGKNNYYFDRMLNMTFLRPYVFGKSYLESILYYSNVFFQHRMENILSSVLAPRDMFKVNRPTGMADGYRFFLDYRKRPEFWFYYEEKIASIHPDKTFEEVKEKVEAGLDEARKYAAADVKNKSEVEKNNQWFDPAMMREVYNAMTPEEKREISGEKYRMTPEQEKEKEKNMHDMGDGHRYWIRPDVYQQMRKQGIM